MFHNSKQNDCNSSELVRTFKQILPYRLYPSNRDTCFLSILRKDLPLHLHPITSWSRSGGTAEIEKKTKKKQAKQKQQQQQQLRIRIVTQKQKKTHFYKENRQFQRKTGIFQK